MLWRAICCELPTGSVCLISAWKIKLHWRIHRCWPFYSHLFRPRDISFLESHKDKQKEQLLVNLSFFKTRGCTLPLGCLTTLKKLHYRTCESRQYLNTEQIYLQRDLSKSAKKKRIFRPTFRKIIKLPSRQLSLASEMTIRNQSPILNSISFQNVQISKSTIKLRKLNTFELCSFVLPWSCILVRLADGPPPTRTCLVENVRCTEAQK